MITGKDEVKIRFKGEMLRLQIEGEGENITPDILDYIYKAGDKRIMAQRSGGVLVPCRGGRGNVFSKITEKKFRRHMDITT